MEIRQLRFYPGPNQHTLYPAVEVTMDLGPYREATTKARPDFVERLLEVLPGLSDHHCGLGHAGGFRCRLIEGTYLGHVVEHVALELVHLGGEDGVYGKTREQEPGVVRIVFETETARGGEDAVRTAATLVSDLWERRSDRPADLLPAFFDRLAAARPGPSTLAIIKAARKLDVPVAILDQGLVRLGQGARQRRIMATVSDQTAVVAVDIAQDKPLTKRVLKDQGIRVPTGGVAASTREAIELARGIGFPVVVKPKDGHHGEGVFMHLGGPADVERAYTFLEAEGVKEVVVEQQIRGIDLRLLVVGGQVVAAAERVPPFVVGNGHDTVADLVGRLNADPRRGLGHDRPMTRVRLDGPAIVHLQMQGHHPRSIPRAGERVWLRATANLSTGGSARDVTDLISPGLAFDVVRAARAVGLDIAGVDVVTPDPGLALQDAGGAVLEVNAAPGLRMHLDPAEGRPRPVAEQIVGYLFPRDRGRIGVASITGTNGKTTVTRMLGHILARKGLTVGMATTDGISIGETVIREGDLTGPWSARLVLGDPTVEVAVLETARGGMARGGLGFDDCDVAVVTNIGVDHLGQDGIQTLEDLVHLKALVVDVVRPEGAAVLNADDPWVLSMAERSRGKVILFSAREGSETVANHLAQGGEAVYVERGNLVYGGPERHYRLVGTRVLPASLGGIAAMNVANAAAAAGAAIALGVPPRLVARALASFPAGGEGANRGRLEVLRGEDLTVLIDYGHNRPAMAALATVVGRLKAKRVVTVLGLPGDRRDQDLVETAAAAAAFSSRVVIREDQDRRGRSAGEVAELIRRGLVGAGMSADAIEVEFDEGEAVRHAIRDAEAGSLVVALYERYWAVKEAVDEGLQARQEASLPREIHA